jgi:hypothetical protein
MALLTMGTAATTTLSAMKFQYTASPIDMGAFEALIKEDQTPMSGLPAPYWGSRVGALDPGTGQLFLPGGRGTILLLPGDFIAVDTQTGFPFVISAAAAAAAGWVHT